MQVFICEDDNRQRNQITKIIGNYIQFEGLNIKIAVSAASPETVLDYLAQNAGLTGLYFLDVDLNHEIDGIILAEKIRKHDPRGFIVFVTGHDEYLPLTFKHKVEALEYISKTDLQTGERICGCIRNAYEKYCGKPTELFDNFVFKINNNIISIRKNAILYFEASQDTAHKIIVYTDDGVYSFYGKMKDLEKELGSRFFRCHKSFLLNLSKVRNVDTANKIAFLEREASCLVSTRQMPVLAGLLRKNKKGSGE